MEDHLRSGLTPLGWPQLTADSPAVEVVIREVFAEAHSPNCRVELHASSDALRTRSEVGWEVDGLPQPALDLARVLTASLHRFKLAALAADPDRLHLHAGLAARVDQRVLVAGASGAGKTTLVATLSGQGFAYGTDEVVALEDDGTVEPLRKPLGLKPGSLTTCAAVRVLRHTAFEDWPLDQAHLGVPSRWMPEGTGPVSLVVLPVRDHARVDATVDLLHPAAAVRLLATHAFDLEALGAPRTLTSLAALVSSAPVVEIHYAEAIDAAREIEALLDELPQPSDIQPTVVAPADRPEPGNGDHPRRATGSCGVLLGDAGVVYAPEPMRIVELSRAAFLVWSSADGRRRRPARAASVIAPVDALTRIDRELLEGGLLVDG